MRLPIVLLLLGTTIPGAACVAVTPATDTGALVTTTGPSTAGGGTTTSGGSTGTTGSTGGTGGGTTGSTGSTGSTSATTAALAYNPDIKALLYSDCLSCHSGSRPTAGYSVATYAQTMTAVRAGSASSILVAVTATNGSMYRYWSGTSATRQAKAAEIRSWVVSFNAQENR